MTLVDSNVLLDVIGSDPDWRSWSVEHLDRAVANGPLAVNPVIYAEISPRFAAVRDLDAFLTDATIQLLPFTRAELFAAGQAHRRYRRSGGERKRVLPDFLIGAQAQATAHALLTRDPDTYRTYFPDVQLITP